LVALTDKTGATIWHRTVRITECVVDSQQQARLCCNPIWKLYGALFANTESIQVNIQTHSDLSLNPGNPELYSIRTERKWG